MSAITIRAFQEDDRPAVEALYETTFGRDALRALQARFRWQYRDHPESLRQPSQLWVGDRDGRILGFLAAFPLRLKIGQDERTILLPCDLMVAKEARFGQNLGGRLMATYLEASGGVALSLAHSRAAAALFEKLGWQAKMLGPIYMRPHRGAPLASRLLVPERMPARLKDLPWSTLQRVAAPALTVGLHALNLVHRPRRRSQIAVRAIHDFGPEFDQLWRALAPSFPVIGVRDRAFLRWRFVADPCTKHALFEARTRRGLAGYIAVCFARARGVLFGRIMDLFCQPGDDDVVDSLLRAGMDHLEAGGAEVIATRGLHPRIRQRVRRFLYMAPPSAQFTARVLCTDQALLPLLYAEGNWHTCHADGDEDFVT